MSFADVFTGPGVIQRVRISLAAMLVLLVGVFSVASVASGLIENLPEGAWQLEFQKLSGKLQALEQTVTDLRHQLEAQKNASKPGTIAFSAVLSNNLTNLGAHQDVVFDGVITNVGNAYSSSQGHFTAPVSGTYAFFLTLTNVPHHSVSCVIVRNGATVARLLASGTPNTPRDQFETSSVTSLVQLNPGDEVWVQNENSYMYSSVEEIDGAWSYFSGHFVGP